MVRKVLKPKVVSRSKKAIFEHLTLSIAGTIYKMIDGRETKDVLLNEDIGRWFTNNGGKYERDVTAATTHLICSIDEFEKKGPHVKKAWDLSSKTNQCKIVTYEWLEDSLIRSKPRKLNEKGYSLDRVIKRLAAGKKNDAKFRGQFEDNVRVSKDLCDNRLHHVYFDMDGFEYKVLLVRISFNGEKRKVEKYTLYLFESNVAPHTYMFGAKLAREHRPHSYYREDCHPKEFHAAFRDFISFFYSRTNIVWDERLEHENEIPSEHLFHYTPPVYGRPVGLLPEGYVRPEPVKGREVDSEEERREDEVKLANIRVGPEVAYDTDSNIEDGDDDGDEVYPPPPSTSPGLGLKEKKRKRDESGGDEGEEGQKKKLNVFEGYGFQPNVSDVRDLNKPLSPGKVGGVSS